MLLALENISFSSATLRAYLLIFTGRQLYVWSHRNCCRVVHDFVVGRVEDCLLLLSLEEEKSPLLSWVTRGGGLLQ